MQRVLTGVGNRLDFHKQSARFSQTIIGLAEPIDDRLHNRFMRF